MDVTILQLEKLRVQFSDSRIENSTPLDVGWSHVVPEDARSVLSIVAVRNARNGALAFMERFNAAGRHEDQNATFTATDPKSCPPPWPTNSSVR